MLDQIEDLMRAGHWLGPAVLGALCYRLLISAPVTSPADDFAGSVLLAISGVILTFTGVKMDAEKHPATAPLVFGAMFVASWTMR